MNKILWFLIGFWLLPSGLAHALKTDVDQPVNLEADSADIDDANKKRVFTGNVLMTQGSIRLTCNQLTQLQAAGDQGSDRYHAKGGPARFKQEIEGKPGQYVEGHAEQIDYDAHSEFLVLSGNAFVTQEGDTFQSDRITYDRVRSLVKGGAAAKGKERVRMVIQSKKDNPKPEKH
jgi:lipopolysaccharide export system protein LptA